MRDAFSLTIPLLVAARKKFDELRKMKKILLNV